MLENLQQDLHDARVLIEQSGTPEEMKRYRKAAEIILVKALHGHPGSEEAKALLQCARALQGGATNSETSRLSVAQSPTPMAAAVAAIAHAPAPQPAAPPPLAVSPSLAVSSSTVSVSPVAAKFDDDLRFTASVPLFEESRRKQKKGSRLKSMLPFGVIALAMFGGGFRLLRSRPADPAPAYAAGSNSRTAFASRPEVPLSRPEAVRQPDPVPVPPRTQAASIAVIPQHSLTRVLTPAVNVTDRETKPNEWTPPPPPPAPAKVAVQINAKPWAQVFLDGPVRRSLGQTPLSGVSVPVGGVLLFENPNFPTKSHRIAAADNAIQVEFP